MISLEEKIEELFPMYTVVPEGITNNADQFFIIEKVTNTKIASICITKKYTKITATVRELPFVHKVELNPVNEAVKDWFYMHSKYRIQLMFRFIRFELLFFHLDTHIRSLDLSFRAYNCLNREGYTTPREISTLSLNQLRAMDHLGQRSFEEIVDTMKLFNIFT